MQREDFSLQCAYLLKDTPVNTLRPWWVPNHASIYVGNACLLLWSISIISSTSLAVKGDDAIKSKISPLLNKMTVQKRRWVGAFLG